MKYLFVLLFLLLSVTVFATTNINYLSEEPTLDGTDFKGASKVYGFLDGKNKLYSNFVTVQMGWTEKGLYFNFVTEQDKLMTNMDASYHDAIVSSEDSVEIFIMPKDQYYQFVTNSQGAKYDSEGSNSDWNLDWKTFSKVEGPRWTCQVFIPFNNNLPKPNEGDAWKFNICRNFKYPMVWASYAPVGGSYHNKEAFDTLIFTKNTSVSVESMELTKSVKSNISINTEKPLNFEWTIKNSEGQGLGSGKEKLKAGENKIEMTTPVPPSMGKDNIFEFSVSEGKNLLIKREITFVPEDDISVSVAPNQSERVVAVNIKSALNNAEICGVITDGEEFQASLEEGQSTVYVPMVYLKDGKNTFVCKLYDENDTTIASKEISLQISENPVWLDNNLGIDENVPAPWTPIVFENNKIGVWGREYDFGDRLFPKSIISQGKELLAGPIDFETIIDGKIINWENGLDREEKLKQTDGTLIFEKEEVFSELLMSCKTTCDFDGLLKFDVIIQPTKKGSLDKLVLKIPLSKDIAKLHDNYAYTFGGGPGFIMPTEEYMMGKLELPFTSQFLPVLWVGDPERGLAFLCEGQENWNLSDTQNAITITDTGKEALLCVNVIDTKTEISKDKPLTLTFGLNITPSKPQPRPADWMTFRPVSTVGHRLHFTCWGGSTRWQGFPIIGNLSVKSGDPAEFDDKGFIEGLKELRSRGLTLPTYLTPSALVTDIPDFVYYRDEWKSVPEIITGTDSGQEIMITCINDKKLQDFFLYYLNDFMNKYDVDGIYMDFSHLQRCANEKHNCGYEKDGKRQPAWPIFGYHEMHKRIYKVMMNCKPNAPLRVIGHCSGGKNLPHINFWDATVDGEYINVDIMGPKYNGDYTTFYRTMDRYVTEYSLDGWGSIPVFDSYNKTPEGTRTAHAYAIQTGAIPWSWLHYATQAEIWRELDEFGVDRVTEFLPYWDNKGVVKYEQDDKIYVATYRNEDKTLFAISNIDAIDRDVHITFDKDYLGLSGEFKVVDLGNKNVVSNSNDLTVNVKAKDFMLLCVE